MTSIGDRMKYIRLVNTKKQKDVAKALETTDATISRYENGERTPKADFIERFADYFKIDINFLHGKTDDPRIKTNAVMIETEQLSKEFKELGIDYITVARKAKASGINAEDLMSIIEIIKQTK